MPPSSAAPTLPRRVLVALALTAALSLGVGAPAAAQVPTTTIPGVLVPGVTTASTAPTTTAAPAATSTPAAADDGLLDFDFDANQKVWIIVGALVAVALLLLVLTIIYWRHTRPDRSAAVGPDKTSQKMEKRRQKAAAKDPFAEPTVDAAPPRDPVAGPLDLDELLGTPDPGRSVFGTSDEPGESPR
jgi:Domain of unknown function (DUF3827)